MHNGYYSLPDYSITASIGFCTQSGNAVPDHILTLHNIYIASPDNFITHHDVCTAAPDHFITHHNVCAAAPDHCSLKCWPAVSCHCTVLLPVLALACTQPAASSE